MKSKNIRELGLIDDDSVLPTLHKYTTRALTAELKRREGVTTHVIGVEDDLRLIISGPAIVLINED